MIDVSEFKTLVSNIRQKVFLLKVELDSILKDCEKVSNLLIEMSEDEKFINLLNERNEKNGRSETKKNV